MVFSFLIYGCLWMSMAQIQFLNGAMEATFLSTWVYNDTRLEDHINPWGIISCPSCSGLILCTSTYIPPMWIPKCSISQRQFFFPMTLGDLGSMKEVRFHTSRLSTSGEDSASGLFWTLDLRTYSRSPYIVSSIDIDMYIYTYVYNRICIYIYNIGNVYRNYDTGSPVCISRFPDLDHICLVESLLFATFVFLALITGLEKLISGLSPDTSTVRIPSLS